MDSLLYGLGIKRDVSSFDISTPNRYFLPLHFRITLAFGDSRLLTPTHVMLYFILFFLPLKVKEYKCSSPIRGGVGKQILGEQLVPNHTKSPPKKTRFFVITFL